MQIPVTGFPFPFPGQSLVISHQTTQLRNVKTLMVRPMLCRQTGQQLSPVERDLTGCQLFGHFGSISETSRRPTESTSRLMRDIRPSRSPINNGSVPILTMRLPATFLSHYRHLDQAPGADFGLSPDQHLIQLILGVTPQLHDPQRTTRL